MKILVARLGLMGDTLMATTILAALQRLYGENIEIDWLAKAGISAKIIRLDQRINQVFTLRHRKPPRWLSLEKQRLVKQLQQRAYDLVINIEFSSHLDDVLTGLVTDAGRYIHFAALKPQPEPRHAVEQMQQRFKLAWPEINSDTDTDIDWSSFAPSLQLEAGDTLSASEIVVLHPGFSHLPESAHKHGPRYHRGWPLEHWCQLAQALLQRGYRIQVTGAPDEEPWLQSLLQIDGVENRLCLDLGEMIADYRRAQGIVCVDSGSAHLAAALGCACCSLYGPTDGDSTGPYRVNNQAISILNSEIECRPCMGTAHGDACKINRCMSLISIEEVLTVVQSWG